MIKTWDGSLLPKCWHSWYQWANLPIKMMCTLLQGGLTETMTPDCFTRISVKHLHLKILTMLMLSKLASISIYTKKMCRSETISHLIPERHSSWCSRPTLLWMSKLKCARRDLQGGQLSTSMMPSHAWTLTSKADWRKKISRDWCNATASTQQKQSWYFSTPDSIARWMAS